MLQAGSQAMQPSHFVSGRRAEAGRLLVAARAAWLLRNAMTTAPGAALAP